jgi:hypothetical protein
MRRPFARNWFVQDEIAAGRKRATSFAFAIE